jgi:hypothetical protein
MYSHLDRGEMPLAKSGYTTKTFFKLLLFACTLLCVVSSVQAIPEVLHLVANNSAGKAYPFVDVSGNGIAITNYTSHTIVTALGGYAVDFAGSGVTDRIIVPDNDFIDLTNSQWTICAWVHWDAVGGPYYRLLTKEDTSSDTYLVGADNNAHMWGRSGTFTSEFLSTNTYDTGGYFDACYMQNATTMSFWVNGTQMSSTPSSNLPINHADPLVIGCNADITGGCSVFTNAQIADIRIFNYYIGKTNATVIYNNGIISDQNLDTLLNPSTAGGPAQFVITGNNRYDNTAILNLSVIATNSTATLTNGTTSGTVRIGGLANISDYTITVNSNYSGGFFQWSNLTRVNGTTSIVAQMYQSIITITAGDKVSNATISNFNVSIPNQFNTSTAGTGTLLVNASTLSLSGAAKNYLNTTQNITTYALKSYNIRLPFFTNRFNITVRDVITGKNISAWATTVTSINYSFSENHPLDYGNLSLNLSNSSDYTLTVTAPGYATNNTNITASQLTGNLTVYLQANNTIYFVLKDEVSNNLIDFDTANIVLSSQYGQLNFTTSNGTLLTGALTPAQYAIDFTFQSGNYFPRRYVVDVPAGYGSYLTAYFINSSIGQYITFFTRNNFDNLLSNVTIMVTKQIGSSWVEIEQRITDVAGSARFSLNPLTAYTLLLSSPNYFSRTASVTPATTPYTIYMQSLSSQQQNNIYDTVTYSTTPSGIVDSNLTNFTFTTQSTAGNILNFTLTVNANNTNYTQSVSSSPGGGIISIPVDLSNLTGSAVTYTYSLIVAGFNPISYNNTIYVGKSPSSSVAGTVGYGINQFAQSLSLNARLVISSFIIAGAALTVAPFVGGIGAGLVGIAVMVLLTSFSFIPAWLSLIIGTLMIMSIITAGRREST